MSICHLIRAAMLGLLMSSALLAQEAGRGAMMDRLERTLHELDLSATQKDKIDGILAVAGEKIDALREKSRNDLTTLAKDAAEVYRDTRSQAESVLTRKQLREFRQKMPDRATVPENTPPAAPDKKPDVKPATKPAPTPEKIAVGAAAPNFVLKNLDNKSVSLLNLRGKPTVLVFGSFTSPTFRDKTAAFDAVRKDYRNKANVLVIYTAEAYPNNEWDVQRNIDEQIRVAQHTSLDERVKMAKLTRDGLKIDTEIVVDDIDDGVAKAYDAMPNGCVILDAAGKIIAKQQWANEHATRVTLDEALRAK
jgi:peroxiredoxin